VLGVDRQPQGHVGGRCHGLFAGARHGEASGISSPGRRPKLTASGGRIHIAVQIQAGQIDHTPALLVIDPQGRERTIYLTQMNYASISQAAQILAGEAASLLPGHPRVASQRSLAHIAGLGPSSPVTLPGIRPARCTSAGTRSPGHVLRDLADGDLGSAVPSAWR